MPGVGMKCLNTIQPIFGIDFHRTIPPVPPVYAAHIVVWGEGWSQKIGLIENSKAASPETGVEKPVALCWGYAIGREHDAGPHPGHLWLNALLPLIYVGSGSKSEFASGTVKHPGGNMAVAVAYAVNLNLNCQDFPVPPLPTGVVVASFCTVKAGFTLGDFLGGILSTLVDMAIGWVLGLICAGIAIGLESSVRGLLGGLRGALRGGQGFLGAFARGLQREWREGWREAFSMSALPTRSLVDAVAAASRIPVTRALMKDLLDPLGVSIGQMVDAAYDVDEVNVAANDWGHYLAGENAESSSSSDTTRGAPQP